MVPVLHSNDMYYLLFVWRVIIIMLLLSIS